MGELPDLSGGKLPDLGKLGGVGGGRVGDLKKFGGLVRLLVEKTDGGKVLWGRTSCKNMFRVKVGESWVEVEDVGGVVVLLRVVDNHCATIGDVSSADFDDEEKGLLIDLFRGARRSAFALDTVLDSLCARLNEL